MYIHDTYTLLIVYFEKNCSKFNACNFSGSPNNILNTYELFKIYVAGKHEKLCKNICVRSRKTNFSMFLLQALSEFFIFLCYYVSEKMNILRKKI